MSTLAPAIPQLRASLSLRRPGLSTAALCGFALAGLSLVVWGAGLVVGFPLALGVLTSVAFAAAIFGLRWPVLGLLGIAMLSTVDSITRNFLLLGGLWRWNTFNYWLLVVIILAAPRLLRLHDPQTRILQLFLAVLGFNLLGTTDLLAGTQHVLNVLIVFGLLVYFLRALRHEEVWFWLGMVAGTVGAVGGLVFYVQRGSLPYINPNSFIHFPLTATFSICLAAHFVAGRSRPLLLLGLLAVVNLVWVFLAGSRGGMLTGLFCAMFLLFEVRGFSRRFTIVAMAGLMGLAILSQFSDLQERALHRIDKLFDPSHSIAGRTSGRSELALAGWHIFLEHPFGVGTGSFADTWAELGGREGFSGHGYHMERQAHSGWIKTLAEAGLPGILLQAAYVASFALVGWSQRRQGMLSLGLLVTAVLTVAFISTEFQSKGLWLLAAGVTALLHYRNNGRHASS